MSGPYPLGLRLDGLPVLVVGGGSVATRRVPALLDAGAIVTIVAPEVTPALAALVDAGRVTLRNRRFTSSDLEECWLAHVAIDDPVAAAEISVAARRRRVFCVRADDRDAATAWTPAITRHGPLTVAVLAGGDPRRAVAVRDSISERLGAGTLDPARRALREAGGARRGASEVVAPAPGVVALVGSGPGDPELITVRGRRLLAAAEVVVADRLVPGLLLDELAPDVELIDVSKIPHGPAASQEEINRILVDRAGAGRFVVRLKGGDPYVFGRGGEEVVACASAGIPVVVVPGVSSAIGVPSSAGIPVTHRAVAHEFTVVTGHLPPGHPKSLVDWAALARLRGTVCVLMGLRNLAPIVEALIAGGRGGNTPVAVIREGTTGGQRTVRGTLETIVARVAEAKPRPPAVVVIGEVVTALPEP